jgi:hypothetical protein
MAYQFTFTRRFQAFSIAFQAGKETAMNKLELLAENPCILHCGQSAFKGQRFYLKQCQYGYSNYLVL